MSSEDFITLKDDQWLYRQKIAGRAVSSSLKEFAKMVKNGGQISLLDIEQTALQQLRSFDCTPTFLNYKPSGMPKPFPGSVCLSVNEVLVHGIPSNYILKDGDVVTLDLGATYEGAIADAAFTCVFGGSKNPKITIMLQMCQNALNESIKAIGVGKNLGIIGNTIFNYVKDTEFGLITAYGGHGLDYNKPHSAPFVHNKARKDEGIVIKPGLAIAIEPMLVLTKNVNTKTKSDGWSVITKEIGCHFEHSVTLNGEGNVHIITDHGMDVLNYV